MLTTKQKNFFFLLSFLVLSLSGCALHNNPESAPSLESSIDIESDEIVNGRIVSKKEELSHSLVALVFQTDQGENLCTGSLIAPHIILTAAHCVDNNPESVKIVFSRQIQKVSDKHIREGTVFIQHPRWKNPEDQGRGDLALVAFKGDAPEGYEPIKLIDSKTRLPEGKETLVMGYGVSNSQNHSGAGILRETSSQIIGNLSTTELLLDGHRSSVCFGDSGGPAFVKVKNHFVQWGVASSVTNSDCNEQSVHTDIRSYKKWIVKAIQKLKKEMILSSNK